MAKKTPPDADDLSKLVPEKRLALLDKGAEIEATHPADTGDLGFTHPLMALVSLPMRDPGDTAVWETRNGSVVFTLRPAIIRGRDGSIVDSGYTYGMTPRRVMLFLMSEAVRTQSPHVQLGKSLRSFLKSVGAPVGGTTVQAVTTQVRRLLASPITLEDYRQDEAGRPRVRGANMSMAEAYEFTFTETDESGIGVSDDDSNVMDSSITLAAPFFNALMKSPAPVDLRAIAAMGSSPLKFDLMAWAAYRLPTLKNPLVMTWDEVFAQFGLADASPRQAKARFRAALEDVRAVYGAAQIEETDEGLRVWPSKPLVQKRGVRGKTVLKAVEEKATPSPSPSAAESVAAGDELLGPALVREALRESLGRKKGKGTDEGEES